MEVKSKKGSVTTRRIWIGVLTAAAAAALLAAAVGFLIVKELLPQQWAAYTIPAIALCAVFLGSLTAEKGTQSAGYAVAVAGIYCAVTLIIKLIFLPGPAVNIFGNVVGCIVGAVLGILCMTKKKKSSHPSRKRR